MDQWKNSPGHMENIVANDIEVLGASYAACNGRYYYTQLFGSKSGGGQKGSYSG
jgi:uncharacterized protein YkwD